MSHTTFQSPLHRGSVITNKQRGLRRRGLFCFNPLFIGEASSPCWTFVNSSPVTCFNPLFIGEASSP